MLRYTATCTITFDGIEFNAENEIEAEKRAAEVFLDMLNTLDNDGDLYKYVDVRVFEEEE